MREGGKQMLTGNEINTTLQCKAGTLKVSVNRLPDGRYQVDSSFFDYDGKYVAHKSGTRICDTFEDITR